MLFKQWNGARIPNLPMALKAKISKVFKLLFQNSKYKIRFYYQKDIVKV